MKISIKKKYIVGIAILNSVVIGYTYLQLLLIKLSEVSPLSLIPPAIFLISIFYTIHYFFNLKSAEKIIDEISRELPNDNPHDIQLVKEHLRKKNYEESYTINFLNKKIKFTSSWAQQAEVEKSKK